MNNKCNFSTIYCHPNIDCCDCDCNCNCINEFLCVCHINHIDPEPVKLHRNRSYNKNNDSEELCKIIMDKEITNKNLEDQINKYKRKYNNLKNGYNQIYDENESLKKIMDEDENNLRKYKSNLISLNKGKKEHEEKCKELENNNKELLNRIKKFKDMEIDYNSLIDENLETQNENSKLKNKMKKMKNDYEKIIYLNDECKDNLNSIVAKYNDLLDKYNDLVDENKYMKHELNKMKKNNDKLKEDYYNDSTQRNEEYSLLKKKYNDLKEKYNSLKNERKNLNEMNKEYESELNDLNQKNDIHLRNIDNLKNKLSMLKTDYNDLNKKYLLNQKSKKEKDLNKDIYNKILNENALLNKEILYLKKKIERYERQLERQKANDDKKRKSYIEDEIVIVNKEFTINKGASGNEYNSSIKKEILSKENDIYKYHELIQELSNMILVYEYFIFNRKIKPKNNHELMCFIIAQNIAKRIREIKINTFIRLILGIYKNNRTKRTKRYNFYE